MQEDEEQRYQCEKAGDQGKLSRVACGGPEDAETLPELGALRPETLAKPRISRLT